VREEEHRSVGIFGGSHSRLDHLQVVDREGGQSPPLFSGEVQGFGAREQHQAHLKVAGAGSVGRVIVISFLRLG
jgi:hypothetical protein